MKKTISLLLMVCLLFLVSCNNQNKMQTNQLPSGNSNVAPSTSPKTEANEKSSAMKSYSAVLRNETKFFEQGHNDNIYLKETEYLSDVEVKIPMSDIDFTVVDIDGDMIPEVVFALNGYGDQRQVFHYADGTVYGYLMGNRSINELKKDGSSTNADSAGCWGISKMQFSVSNYKFVDLARIDTESDNKGQVLEIRRVVNNATATEAEFDAFVDRQDEKADVIWYKLNEDNIKSQIVIE